MADRDPQNGRDGSDVRANDEQWFRSLWEDHADAILAYARRRTDSDTASEVVAGTFLVAWRRRRDVPDESLPWLYGVARRVLADQHRSGGRRARLTERLAHAPDPPASDPAVTVVERDAALAALERLSETDREALRLTCWEQLSAGEAAQVVGCSAATFTVRLHRARRRLRGHLDADDEHRPADAVLPRVAPLRGETDAG